MCYIFKKRKRPEGVFVFSVFRFPDFRFQFENFRFIYTLFQWMKIVVFSKLNCSMIWIWHEIPAYLTLSEGEKIILSFARNWMSMNIIWQSIVFALEIQFCRNHWRGNTLSCYILHVISMFVREKRQDCHVKRVNPFDLLLLSFIFYLADFL